MLLFAVCGLEKGGEVGWYPDAKDFHVTIFGQLGPVLGILAIRNDADTVVILVRVWGSWIIRSQLNSLVQNL